MLKLDVMSDNFELQAFNRGWTYIQSTYSQTGTLVSTEWLLLVYGI